MLNKLCAVQTLSWLLSDRPQVKQSKENKLPLLYNITRYRLIHLKKIHTKIYVWQSRTYADDVNLLLANAHRHHNFTVFILILFETMENIVKVLTYFSKIFLGNVIGKHTKKGRSEGIRIKDKRFFVLKYSLMSTIV